MKSVQQFLGSSSRRVGKPKSSGKFQVQFAANQEGD
jgi:hypothetical protein